MIIRQLKKEAIEKLKGKWKKAILFMIIFYITNILISYIVSWVSSQTTYGMIINIFRIVVIVALNYGIVGSFIKIKRDEKVNFLHYIFYAGRDVEKVWRTIGRLLLRFIWYILGFLLAAYLVITECISLYYGYGVRLSFFIEIICFIFITIFFVKEMLYYALNNYIIFDNKEWKAKEILNESKRLMKNHRWDFIKLNLSFIGWQVLGMTFSIGLILCLYFFLNINNYALLYISYIPLIFLSPYTYTTTICFYENILYNNPKPKDNEINSKKTKRKFKNKEKKK